MYICWAAQQQMDAVPTDGLGTVCGCLGPYLTCDFTFWIQITQMAASMSGESNGIVINETNEALSPENNRNPVEEFRYYMDKSQQLFAGLRYTILSRELPHTGRNWHPYYQRTFEVYTRLWKHQQLHR